MKILMKYNPNDFDINGEHKDTKDKYDPNGFDINGEYKDTKDTHDPNGFNIDEKHKKTNYKYDPNDFDIKGFHKDTGFKYNPNIFDIKGVHNFTKDKYNYEGFDVNGIHKNTKDKYDPDCFDINGKHKDTGTFLNKINLIRHDIFNNIHWLENKSEFLKLYDKIIKNGEFTETVNKKVISSKIFKDFIEDILSGDINVNNNKKIYKKRLDSVKNDLTKSKKSKNANQLKDYLTKIKDLTGIKDRIKVDEAKSFKDQKGKGYADLPILLSKIYINNNSKELTNNIKNLLNHLYNNKQITKQVYNILNKAITYKNDS